MNDTKAIFEEENSIKIINKIDLLRLAQIVAIHNAGSHMTELFFYEAVIECSVIIQPSRISVGSKCCILTICELQQLSEYIPFNRKSLFKLLDLGPIFNILINALRNKCINDRLNECMHLRSLLTFLGHPGL